VAETDELDNHESLPVAVVADGDRDGVPDGVDLCPNENASNFDANGDGCIDALRSARHIEYWDAADFPLVYVINQDGAPDHRGRKRVHRHPERRRHADHGPGGRRVGELWRTTPQQDAQALDGVNIVTFADPDYKFPAGVLAVGISTSFTEPTFFNGELIRPGKIVDADIDPQSDEELPDADRRVGHRSPERRRPRGVSPARRVALFGKEVDHVLRAPAGTQASTLETEDELMLLKSYPTPATLSGASRLRGG